MDSETQRQINDLINCVYDLQEQNTRLKDKVDDLYDFLKSVFKKHPEICTCEMYKCVDKQIINGKIFNIYECEFCGGILFDEIK